MSHRPYSIRLDPKLAKTIERLGVESDRKFSDMARHLLRRAVSQLNNGERTVGAGKGDSTDTTASLSITKRS